MRLADIFTDNMVLQRNKKIAVFGFGKGNGCIEFCGKKTDFNSTDDKFCIYLPPEKAGGPYDMTVTLNDNKTVLKNILIGDVFLAAGQSNIEMKLSDVTDIKKISNPNIRFFTEPDDMSESGMVSYNKTDWQICTEQTVDFSAIGYGVSQILNQKTDIPIGIISVNKGASRVDSWTSPEIVNTPDYQKMIEIRHADYYGFKFNQNCWCYTNKLLPIVPFSVSGVLWYQGESNRRHEEGVHYRKMLKLMIENWRNLWQECLPFYLVQLMPFNDIPINDWAEIRKQQEAASKTIKNVYLTTLVNTDEADKIHPTKKSMVCVALANAILNTLFGFKCEYCGPVVQSFSLTDKGVVINFSHADGLKINGDELTDTFVYDTDNEKHLTFAEIKNNALEINWQTDAKIKKITMGYCNSPKHNLYNGAGFLASPFEITID